MYLSDYNDRLMKAIQNNNRVGVPQGPAYARILAELYLDHIIKTVCDENNSKGYCGKEGERPFHIFRYVDDIVVVCEDKEMSEQMYARMCDGFRDRNMPVNKNKTRYYGRLSEMTQDECRQIMHTDHFNYELTPGRGEGFLVESDKSERLSRYALGHPFDIGLLGYLYGNRTFKIAQHYYFHHYGKMIMGSSIGRGKSFRHFYAYVLGSQDRIQDALKNGWFHDIPVGTVNYSNFISTLYFFIQRNLISEKDLRSIVMGYLSDGVSVIGMSEEDGVITRAIVEWDEARGLDWTD